MIELNCQNYLNTYLNKQVIYQHKENCKNLMLIVETRLSLSLILVIKNALYKMANFNLMVISTKNTINFLEKIFGKLPYKIEINKQRINLVEYSKILLDQNIWKRIKEDRILIFQSDSIVLRNIKESEFQNLSMIGPVCVHLEDKEKFVMNGGFSLRNKDLMLDLCTNKPITSNVEDIFFTEQIRKYYPELMPSIEDCNNFAIESVGNKLTAKGLHGTDKYYRTFDGYKEIFDTLEISS
tara:strand:- start:961 stop:1677 length:717 start_codon:yes stop_codon:yes gene_type:complete